MKIRKTTQEEREAKICGFIEYIIDYGRNQFALYMCDRSATYKAGDKFRCGLHIPSKKVRTRMLSPFSKELN